MRTIPCVLSVAALLLLAGCASNDSANYSRGPILGAVAPPAADAYPADTMVANAPPPSQVVTSGVQNLDIAAFVDASAYSSMGPSARAEASSAQYYALQFGRVGAARTWTGDNGTTGQINVGPYVKVNNRDCRDFTNVVNVGAKSFTKRGTACREESGVWTVGAASAAASGVGASG